MQFSVTEKRAIFKTVYLGNIRVDVGCACVVRQGLADIQRRN